MTDFIRRVLARVRVFPALRASGRHRAAPGQSTPRTTRTLVTDDRNPPCLPEDDLYFPPRATEHPIDHDFPLVRPYFPPREQPQRLDDRPAATPESGAAGRLWLHGAEVAG